MAAPNLAAQVGAAVACIAPLLALMVLRMVTTPSPSHLIVLGHNLDLGCLVRHLLHLRCPACGVTRSVVYALHGDLLSAVQINAAGPIAVFGAAILSLGGFVVVTLWLTGRMPLSSVRRFFASGPSVYAALLLAALIGQ